MTTEPAKAKLTFRGGRPGWRFHLHAAEVDFEGVFPRDGTITIPVDPRFYSVMHQAVTWGEGGAEGVVLPLQMRVGDTVDIGGP